MGAEQKRIVSMKSSLRLQLLLVCLVATVHQAAAAHSASPHEMLLQHAWHKFEDRGDWSDWEETWKLVDRDGDGSIQVNHGELNELFKEHYNILHHRLDVDDKHQYSGVLRATDSTFEREASKFMELRERLTGAKHAHEAMSWTEFHSEMTVFMNEMKPLRGPLLEVANNPLLQLHKDL